MDSRKFLHVLMTLTTLLLTTVASAGASRFTTIDYPGAATTFVWGINVAGDITGSYVDSAGNEHGYLLHDGNFTSLDYPGADWTQAYGISASGDIVGMYGLLSEKNTITHGFLWHKGTFTAVELAGPTDQGPANSMPYGIMPDGTIVGCYHQSTSTGAVIGATMRGFMLRDGAVTFNATNFTMNTAVNANGDMVGYGTGYASGPAATHAYLLHDGTFTWFNVPGAASTQARGIAANGDIAGVYQDAATKKIHGYLYRQGNFTSFDVPGAVATRPMAMNASGDIAGYYNDAGGKIHGFLFRKTGFWWNPAKPGSGFLMERQGGNMSVTAFVYSWDGTPTWLTATAPFVSGTFTAEAHMFAQGQTLTGAYQPAQDLGPRGFLQIQFTDAGTAQLLWAPDLFTFTTATLQRFGFTGGPASFGTVENGLWSNPSEPGRSFSIEVQDGSLFILGSMFDAAGSPTWYLSYGKMTDPLQYSGSWSQYGQGPTMLGVGGTPLVTNANAGAVKLTFTDARNGTLTLPDGRQIPISRLSF